jgi:RecB family exonuclease
VTLDARTQGTLAHAVLERVPASAFGGTDAETVASGALVAEGVSAEHSQHGAIVARIARFLRGSYAQAIVEQRAEIRREVAFVLAVDDVAGRSLVLRGSMDLVVVWPDGAVDVVDYKSARAGAIGAYAFQLDIYALAAREMFPEAPRLRAGLVYLGGASAAGEPSWRMLPDEADLRNRLAGMGERLVRARWGGAFPRVGLERCESIYCGFIGRCHASTAPPASGSPPEEKGTDAKPSRATTT